MVAPEVAPTAGEDVWTGNEIWPGCGGWGNAPPEPQPATESESDCDENYNVGEYEPEEMETPEQAPANDNKRREATWGALRIISGATSRLRAFSPKPYENLEDDVLTPRSAAIRRVLGESVESDIHAGSGAKRMHAFEIANENICSATLSQSGTALMDPNLRLEPVSRATFVKVVFDVSVRALSDPMESIRAYSQTIIESSLRALRQYSFKEELSPLTRQLVTTMIGTGNKCDKPGECERYESILNLFIAEPMIGIKGVVAELYSFVQLSDLMIGPATHDWVLQLISRLLQQHHILPAGEIPLESTTCYALKFLNNAQTPGSRQQLAMSLLTQLYKLAQKRLQKLIASVKPVLHRRLTDAFDIVDEEARGEARKRRPTISAGSRRPSRENTATRRMSFLEGGDQVVSAPLPPVLMDTGMLLKCVKQRRAKNETEADLLMRVTHLHCGQKGAADIKGLEQTRRVQVLYLNDNYIPRIENLSCLRTTLTHLYLQNNHIQEMEGLSELSCLTKLYLDKNRISWVQGLEGCTRLEELHLNDQGLQPGDQMDFCPHSMEAIGRTLRVLNVSNNNVADVTALGYLQRLDSLDLAGSAITDVLAVNYLTSNCPFMTKLNLEKSAVVKDRLNCEEILAHAEYLEEFNGKQVTEKERSFLRRLAERKSKKAIVHGRRNSHSAGDRRPSESTGGVAGNGCLPSVPEHPAKGRLARRGSTMW